MSWRTVVIRSRAKLDLQLGYLVIRGEELRKIYLDEVGTLIVESTMASMTAALLNELVLRNIKVLLCDVKHNPSVELLPCHATCRSSGQIREQIAWSQEEKDSVWADLIRRKIWMQSEVLRCLKKSEAMVLAQLARSVEAGDSSNREAQAARIYFPALFGDGFCRSEICAVNAALNYGYTILLSCCNREIAGAGYLTQVGIHHDNQYNLFNLGSDVMEPLRPFFDIAIYNMWQMERLESFDRAERDEVLTVLQSTVLFDGKRHVLDFAAGLYVKSVLRAVTAHTQIKWCEFLEGGA